MTSELDQQLKGYQLTTVEIVYYMPRYQHLIQTFTWQTLDIQPKYPRIHKFLDFWRREIDAIIKDINIGSAGTLIKPASWKNVHRFDIN